ncbi:hypothetical protein K458DRAFT_432492, partial [Lentithecium fluviatile CBS 122367]
MLVSPITVSSHPDITITALKRYSEYFDNSLRLNKANGHESTILEGDDASAVHVWLTYIPAAKKGGEERGEDDRPFANVSTDEMSGLFHKPAIHTTEIKCVWNVITAGDRYFFQASLLTDFFSRWFAKNIKIDDDLNPKFARQLALPCFMFDYAEGFVAITRWLAYNYAGQVTENRPRGFKWKHMHLCPPDFVGRYFAALVRAEAYPLEKYFPKNSINTILSRLDSFILRRVAKCPRCNIDCEDYTVIAIKRTQKNFDGLCIDCMDRSRLKRDSTDADYWKHCKSVDGKWDHKCRVDHGQQTWYVRWCGRDEFRRKLLDEHREERLRREGF